MKTRKLLSVLLALVMVLAMLPAGVVTAYADTVASGTCGDDLTWTLDDAGTLTISGQGAMEDFSRAPWRDHASAITAVVISSGVTTVGSHAFEHCTKLVRVTIPSGVTAVGESAFFNCTSLTAVTLPGSVTEISGGAFTNCTALSSVTLPEGLTSIGSRAFMYCTALPTLAIPAGVTAIGENAFSGCTSLTEIRVAAGNPVYSSLGGVLFNAAQTELLRCPPGKSGAYAIPSGTTAIAGGAFNYCPSLTSVTIPEGVTTIGKEAFQNCTALTSVTLPSTVTTLGSSVFSGCSALRSAAVPKGVQYIRSYTFLKCTSLTSVTIPASVTLIENYAFQTCTALTDVYYGGSAEQWEQISIASGNDPLTNATLHPSAALTITRQPVDFTGAMGDMATFSVAASGDGLTYQWQVNSGSGWKNSGSSGNKTTKLKAGAITEARLGYLYRCIITDQYGNSVTSNEVRMILVTPLQIVRQPVDFEGEMGATATFTVVAEGDGLSYQWQVNDGSGWKDSGASGNKTAKLKAGKITEARLACLYRCLVTDRYGSTVTSDEVRMVLVTPLQITRQPADFEGEMGVTAYFTVAAEGDGLKYQWQVNSGSGWKNSTASGNKTAKLKAGAITETRLGYLYRCLITDSHGNTVTSDEVRMVLPPTPLTIIRQPVDFEGNMGDMATFTVAAEGDGLKYQWQVNSGSGWKNSTASGNKTAKLKAGAITEARLGYLYRCLITDSHGNTVTTNEVKMVLASTPLTITRQPVDFAGRLGDTATFTVAAEGDGLSYQWQVNSGSGWKNSGASGNKTAKLKAGTVTEARLAYLYRCVITDERGSTVTTNEVRMIKAEATGTCGEGLTWALYDDGHLLIGGTGDMPAFSYDYTDDGEYAAPAPWADYELESVTIQPGVTSVSSYAFYLCDSLVSVSIPGTVTAIGDYAFHTCTSLTELKLPSGVVSIGSGAFGYCVSIASASLPATLASVGQDAFADCDLLADVYYGGTAQQWAQISIASGNRALTNAARHYSAAQ